MRAIVLLLSILALAPHTAAAQARDDVVIVVEDGAPEHRARAWRARAREALEAGDASVSAWSAAIEPAGTIEPDRLTAIREIEARLVSARRSAVRLEERDALRELREAEALAEQHLAIPGMAAWYAEVELAIALTASQAGLTSLATAALRRAASVDPTRTVRAGEAPPELVERSQAAVRAAVTGPRGRFEVRADAPLARAFLDDRELGALPQTIEAPAGPHVLRIDAPGFRSWASIIEVFEGERAPMEVRLAPTEARTNAMRADAAAREGRVEALETSLRALAPLGPPPVWMLWAGSGPEDRAIALRCDASGCASPVRLERASLGRLREGRPALAGEGELASALEWLDAPTLAVAADEPWWERWYVWVAAGVVLAAGAAALGVALEPRGPGPLQIEIDPTHLPSR